MSGVEEETSKEFEATVTLLQRVKDKKCDSTSWQLNKLHKIKLKVLYRYSVYTSLHTTVALGSILQQNLINYITCMWGSQIQSTVAFRQ